MPLSEPKNQGVNPTVHLGVNLTELGAPLGSSLQYNSRNGHGPSAYFQILNPFGSILSALPAFSVLLPLIGWCAPRQDAGVGVALLIPMAASVDLLEDPIRVSHCRDITSEGQGGPGRRFHPSHTCTQRHSQRLKSLNNLPAARADHSPPLPTPTPQFSGLACGLLRDKPTSPSTSPGLRIRMSEVTEPPQSTSSMARFYF